MTASSLNSNFEPRSYQSDGGFTVPGMMITMAAGVVTALIVGAAAGFAAQYFYLVILFPLIIGMAVGGAQMLVIGTSKIRNPMICGLSGMLAGLLAVMAMHYVEYQHFNAAMAEGRAETATTMEAMPLIEDPEIRAQFARAMADYENEPTVIAAKQVNSFPQFIDYSAKMGLELTSAKSADSPGINLGYFGTYIYWGIEALIIAGCCFIMTRNRAAEPFCTHCESWMTENEFALLNCDANTAAGVVETAQLNRLPMLANDGKQTAISIFSCGCDGQQDVVLQCNSITYNNGSRCTQNRGRFVFPESVVDELTQVLFPNAANEDATLADVQSAIDNTASEISQFMKTPAATRMENNLEKISPV